MKEESENSFNWLQMIAIGFGVLGIGFLIAIVGYLLSNGIHK